MADLSVETAGLRPDGILAPGMSSWTTALVRFSRQIFPQVLTVAPYAVHSPITEFDEVWPSQQVSVPSLRASLLDGDGVRSSCTTPRSTGPSLSIVRRPCSTQFPKSIAVPISLFFAKWC